MLPEERVGCACGERSRAEIQLYKLVDATPVKNEKKKAALFE